MQIKSGSSIVLLSNMTYSSTSQMLVLWECCGAVWCSCVMGGINLVFFLGLIFAVFCLSLCGFVLVDFCWVLLVLAACLCIFLPSSMLVFGQLIVLGCWFIFVVNINRIAVFKLFQVSSWFKRMIPIVL